MYPSQHLFWSIIFAGIVFLLIPTIGIFGFLLIVLSSVLIDFDHYLYYVYKKRDFNPINSRNWFTENSYKMMELSRTERNNMKRKPFIFHGIEVLTLLLIISFFWKPVFFIFIGFAFHLLLDMVDQPRIWDKYTKISLINDFLKSDK